MSLVIETEAEVAEVVAVAEVTGKCNNITACHFITHIFLCRGRIVDTLYTVLLRDLHSYHKNITLFTYAI